MTRVVFLHGLEGSPHGTKARFLGTHFDCMTPALSTRHAADTPGVPEVVVDEALAALAAHVPDVVVGSSFGGAVLLELACRGDWSGPSIFLASAGPARTPHRRLPHPCGGSQCLLIHGRGDKIVPYADSERFAAENQVALWAVDDGHRLHTICTGERPLLQRAVESVFPAA